MLTPEQRLNRIEELLERIAEEHLDLEAAQTNQAKAHTTLVETVSVLAEHMTNVKILVDRLIERDLNR